MSLSNEVAIRDRCLLRSTGLPWSTSTGNVLRCGSVDNGSERMQSVHSSEPSELRQDVQRLRTACRPAYRASPRPPGSVEIHRSGGTNDRPALGVKRPLASPAPAPARVSDR